MLRLSNKNLGELPVGRCWNATKMKPWGGDGGADFELQSEVGLLITNS